mgnify:CR=1 FL=1
MFSELNDKTGEFIDLFYHVKDNKITRETEIEACAMGDIHVAHVDDEVVDELDDAEDAEVDAALDAIAPTILLQDELSDEEKVEFLLPNTFMNNSGNAVCQIIDDKKKLKPKEIAFLVNDLLVEQFPDQTNLLHCARGEKKKSFLFQKNQLMFEKTTLLAVTP